MIGFDNRHSGYVNPARNIGVRSLLRASMPIAILLFCAGFNFAYVNWVSPTWGYWGLTYKAPNVSLLVLGYALALFTCVTSPKRIERPSHVIYWFCFFAVYIPGLFVPLYLQLDNGFQLLLLQLSLAGSMLLIALFYRVPRFRVRSYPADTRLFWFFFWVLFVVGNFALIYTFRGMMHIVAFSDVYSIRTPAKQVLRSNPEIAYISQFLSTVMNPLLMGYGLAQRRRLLFIIGAMGEVLLYSTAAVKGQMAAPLVVLLLYFSLRRDRGGWISQMALAFAGIFFALTIISAGVHPGALFNLAFFVLVRVFTIPGSEMAQYQHFFQNMPHTYFSHIGMVSHFLPNPYELSIGEEISSYYGITGKYGLSNANASFFAMDGIAGFGLPGILLMGLLCGLVFWILDSCARDFELKFSVPVLATVIISLTNVSLFTTLLGNGLIAWMLLFLLMPRMMRKPVAIVHYELPHQAVSQAHEAYIV